MDVMSSGSGESNRIISPVRGWTKPSGALAYFRSSVASVVEEGMPDVVHVNPDLVGPSRLQAALYHCDIAESFEDLVVGDGMLSPFVIFRVDLEAEAVVGITPYGTVDSTLIFLDVPPNNSDVKPLDAMFEKLFRQIQLGFVILCHHQQA